MSIYTKSRTKVNYRKIYEQNYGPIPEEESGRSYDIHHIDGNCHNNHPSNLVAVTKQEHYDIHLQQGDYAAAMLISTSMDITADERSRLASNSNAKRIREGTHPWLGGTVQRGVTQKRLDEGSFHLQRRPDGTSHATDRVKNGTHPWQMRSDGSSFSKDRVKNGLCPLTKRSDGSSSATEQLANGTHPSLVEWTCSNCNKNGRGSGNYTRWHSEGSPLSCHHKRIN